MVAVVAEPAVPVLHHKIQINDKEHMAAQVLPVTF
jgi:hypothetical protein